MNKTYFARRLLALSLFIVTLTVATPPFASSLSQAGGKFAEFAIPTPNSGPSDITFGPDGNFWFLEQQNLASKVGRITPGGQITEFPLPSNQSAPTSITVGPDGNLWFTADGRAKIGKITPVGQITEFSVLIRGEPTNITRGPKGDHNLWFTLLSGQIGKIDPTSGHMALFATPGVPQDITASLGFLWFTDTASNAIGRMSVTGKVTEFPIPTTDSGAQGITAAPNGTIWFTEFKSDKIGNVTTH